MSFQELCEISVSGIEVDRDLYFTPKKAIEVAKISIFQLQDITKALAALRDGIREADEIKPWRDIVDMMLEYHVDNLNRIMKDLSKTFDGLEYEPVRISSHTLLRKRAPHGFVGEPLSAEA